MMRMNIVYEYEKVVLTHILLIPSVGNGILSLVCILYFVSERLPVGRLVDKTTLRGWLEDVRSSTSVSTFRGS